MKKLSVFGIEKADLDLIREKLPKDMLSYEFHLATGDTSPESLIFVKASSWIKLDDEEKEELAEKIRASFKILEGTSEQVSEIENDFSDPHGKILKINFDQPVLFVESALRVFLSSMKNSESRELLKIGQSLNQLVTQSLRELQRVKKIHETLVPLRCEKIKGLTIHSKFAAGESSGGEFYDVVEGDREFVIMISHTSSYVASSMVLSEFDLFRQKKSFSQSDLEDFSLKIGKKIKGTIPDKDFHNTHLFLARVDMKSLLIEGVNWGKFQLISDDKFFVGENNYFIDESFLSNVSFASKLNRSCQYAVISPGLRRCCDDRMLGKELLSYLKELLPEGAQKFLQEIFYQLKKDRDSSFLEYDATSIFIEVDQNVIVQI